MSDDITDWMKNVDKEASLISSKIMSNNPNQPIHITYLKDKKVKKKKKFNKRSKSFKE